MADLNNSTGQGSQYASSGLQILFWLGFYGVGILVLPATYRSIGRTSPLALLLQVLALIWILGVISHLRQAKLSYLAAGAWALLLALPLAVQVVRRLHFWITIGMEPPDGMGSPLAFFINFVFEWMLFLPLCMMLAILAMTRPWAS